MQTNLQTYVQAAKRCAALREGGCACLQQRVQQRRSGRLTWRRRCSTPRSMAAAAVMARPRRCRPGAREASRTGWVSRLQRPTAAACSPNMRICCPCRLHTAGGAAARLPTPPSPLPAASRAGRQSTLLPQATAQQPAGPASLCRAAGGWSPVLSEPPLIHPTSPAGAEEGGHELTGGHIQMGCEGHHVNVHLRTQAAAQHAHWPPRPCCLSAIHNAAHHLLISSMSTKKYKLRKPTAGAPARKQQTAKNSGMLFKKRRVRSIVARLCSACGGRAGGAGGADGTGSAAASWRRGAALSRGRQTAQGQGAKREGRRVWGPCGGQERRPAAAARTCKPGRAARRGQSRAEAQAGAGSSSHRAPLFSARKQGQQLL